MCIELRCEVPDDGCLAMDWRTGISASSFQLLIVRTGIVPAYTSLRLSGETEAYRIEHLSRHQRYRVCILAIGPDGLHESGWWNVTPRAGVRPIPERESGGLAPLTSKVTHLTIMPQDQRLTAWWELSPGFVDRLVLELWRGQDPMQRLELEPEVTSIALDSERGCALENGQTYRVAVHTRFAGVLSDGPPPVACIPAPQGLERQSNRELSQRDLIYPTLGLAPELVVFDEEIDLTVQESPTAAILCGHCRKQVRWDRWRLTCESCGAEFIPNGRGDYLDVAQLRFGTCRCCLPKKILIQKAGTKQLVCTHSGKEHIRGPESRGFLLIEDLPFGLCQCCRPRRPLERKARAVRCTKSNEEHTNRAGRWVLVPSRPVFDASAIDDLLDAGMAEICSTGVSSRRQKKKGRKAS